MRNMAPLVKKELGSFFNSPVAYILGVAFLVFMSVWFFFVYRFPASGVATLRGYFGVMPLVFVVLVPALTMRSWAEERKLGTAELLLTLPYRESALVLAKFAAAFLLLALLLVLTVPVPLTVLPLGDFETGEILGEYMGVLLLGAAAVSIGQFASVLSSNQISAFLLGFFTLLFFSLVHLLAGAFDPPAAAAAFFRYVSLDHHFQSFRKGVLDSRDLVYFLATAFLFQYLTVKALVFRKWR